MDSSESLDAIGAALAQATGELQNVVADKINPHFRSKYVSLPAMLDEVRPTLAKHGLAVVQFPVSHDDGRIGVETMLLHASGQYVSGRLYVTPQKHDPQGAGSAITYCRRYGLAAVLGIGQEDDDANAASTPPSSPTTRAPAPPRPAPQAHAATPPQHENGAISEKQGKRLWALAAKRADWFGPDAGIDKASIVREVLGRRGIDSTLDIPKVAYERICSEVESWNVPDPNPDNAPPSDDEPPF